MSKSEFGRGYATCLRQFTFHGKRLGESIESYAKFRASGHADLFDEASVVETWANGASDHLYELVKPKRGVPVAEWRRAKAVQDRALDIGHGFRATSKSTPAEAEALLAESAALLALLAERVGPLDTLEAAMEADRALGLAPEKGAWSCTEDLRRTS